MLSNLSTVSPLGWFVIIEVCSVSSSIVFSLRWTCVIIITHLFADGHRWCREHNALRLANTTEHTNDRWRNTGIPSCCGWWSASTARGTTTPAVVSSTRWSRIVLIGEILCRISRLVNFVLRYRRVLTRVVNFENPWKRRTFSIHMFGRKPSKIYVGNKE